MKTRFRVVCMLAFSVMVFVIGCTKEGPQGPPGADGTNGINGNDGTAGCITCHKNDSELTMKTAQYERSKHLVGGVERIGYANYAGGACSMCHSHNGFVKAIQDDANFGGLHGEASVVSCYTCHQIHTTYTRDDYMLRYTSAVDLFLNENDVFTGLTVDATSQYSDPDGYSNTCVKCHQPRHRGDTQPDPSLTGSFTISDGAAAHWGPHYGAQGALFGGVGGYIGTTDPTKPSNTKGPHSCKSCHMSFTALTGSNGEYIGGHSLIMANTQGDVNFNACNECHTENGATIDLPGKMAANKILLDDLYAELLAQQIIDAEGHLKGGTWTHQQLAAYWNYALVKNDGSYGIHNEDYTQQLINAARSYLGPN